LRCESCERLSPLTVAPSNYTIVNLIDNTAVCGKSDDLSYMLAAGRLCLERNGFSGNIFNGICNKIKAQYTFKHASVSREDGRPAPARGLSGVDEKRG
jgi:hypothetical protein